jgi:hypothetical protein
MAALGVWTACGSWAGDNLSDGFVPDEVVARYDPSLLFAPLLVDVGLWVRTERDGEAGYQYHQWLDRQKSRSDVEKQREGNRDRVRRWRAQHAPNGSSPDPGPEPSSDPPGNGPSALIGNALRTPAVTRTPIPNTNTKKKTKTSSSEAAPRPDVDQLCALLQAKITERGSKPPEINKQWRDAARLLLDRDERPHAEAIRLIEWCQNHHFWHTNILSMPKFRKQYDTLRLQAQQEHTPNLKKASGSYQPYTDPIDLTVYREGKI